MKLTSVQLKKPIVLVFLSLFLSGLAALLYLFPIKQYYSWEIVHPHEEISWVPFLWSSDYLGDSLVERTAIMIPVHIEGISKPTTFQLDLGAGNTGFYELSLLSITDEKDELTSKIKNHRYKYLLPKKTKYFDGMRMSFGDYKLNNKKAYIYQDYGSRIINSVNNDTLHNIGTIGTDIFHDKVLIIDYPKRRFAVCKSVPKEFHVNFIDIELNNEGMIILPMKHKAKMFRVLLDTGASLFELWTLSENVSKFTSGENIDTLAIHSWGNKHEVTSKIITDTIELAGVKFTHVKIYANHTDLGIDSETDATAGNALFWDRIAIIDFKNRKFGLK